MSIQCQFRTAKQAHENQDTSVPIDAPTNRDGHHIAHGQDWRKLASTTSIALLSRESPTMKATILNSWKQIAEYVGRGVRTVQRWEHKLGLRVRRPRHHLRSPVGSVY